MQTFFYLVVISLLFLSCGTTSDKSQGEIVYKITYEEFGDDAFASSILPSEMIVSFKDHNFKATIESGYGVFAYSQIYNKREQMVAQVMKYWKRKYYYSQKVGEDTEAFSYLPEFKVKYDSDTTTIAGFKCKKAYAYVNSALTAREVFYTDEICLEDPNIATPFANIKGVLLDFPMKIGSFNMRLTACHINWKKINDDIFKVPTSYERIGKEEMLSILHNLEPL